jgi:hypothetical protein
MVRGEWIRMAVLILQDLGIDVLNDSDLVAATIAALDSSSPQTEEEES